MIDEFFSPTSRWTGQARHSFVDLRLVTTDEAFRTELSKSFPIDPDSRQVWSSLGDLLLYQSGPLFIRFIGWPEFAKRMPRYARRLDRLLKSYQARVGVAKLSTVFE